MPVVFVHGVGTREGSRYQESVESRDAFLRRLTLPSLVGDASAVAILNPYWGGQAARLAWEGRSLPREGVESLGAADEAAAEVLSETLAAGADDPDAVVLQVAKRSLVDAVDLMVGLASQGADAGAAAELAALASDLTPYSLANPRPAWVSEVSNDQQLLDRLQSEAELWQRQEHRADEGETPEWESLGLSEAWDAVREAADRLAGVAHRAAGQALTSVARAGINAQAALFFGDIFLYLKERGTREMPGPIVKIMSDALDEAIAKKSEADSRLIVMAHSMGGNIMYDTLTYFRSDVACDLFVTIGSQVALFEELKLFVVSEPSVPTDPTDPAQRVPKPANVGRWINIFDDTDVLGYAVEGVFQDSTDFRFVTGEGIRASHTAYFARPSFYARMGERIRGALG